MNFDLHIHPPGEFTTPAATGYTIPQRGSGVASGSGRLEGGGMVWRQEKRHNFMIFLKAILKFYFR
jgi:hypothetical protein